MGEKRSGKMKSPFITTPIEKKNDGHRTVSKKKPTYEGGRVNKTFDEKKTKRSHKEIHPNSKKK
jgi:hypothetical protein